MKKIFKIMLLVFIFSSMFLMTGCDNKDNKKISVLIVGKDNKKLYSKKIKTNKNTIMEVLNDIDVKAKFKESDTGAYVISLMNQEQAFDDNGSYYWTYYVDDESSDKSISDLKVEDSKTYKFVYSYYSY